MLSDPYTPLLKSSFNALPSKEANSLDIPILIQQVISLQATIKMDATMILGLSHLIHKRYRALRNELQALRLDQQDRPDKPDRADRIVTTPTRRTKKKARLILEGCSALDDSQLGQLASSAELSLDEVRRPVTAQDLMAQVEDYESHTYRTPIRDEAEEQIRSINFEDIQVKLRERRQRHQMPTTSSRANDNFMELMKFSFAADSQEHAPEATKKRSQVRYPIATTRAVTVDKKWCSRPSQVEQQINWSIQSDVPVDSLDEFELRDRVLFDPKDTINMDVIDLALFRSSQRWELSAELPAQHSGISFTQFLQISDQVLRDEDSVHSDWMPRMSEQQQRQQTSQLRRRALDEVAPHLQTIKETISNTGVESKSNMNLSLRLQAMEGSEKALALYELLGRVARDGRYILQQDCPEQFGVIECFLVAR